MNIPLADALVQLKDELRQAVRESDKEIVVLIPDEIQVELSIGFELSTVAKAGFKIFAIVDSSVDAGGKRTTEHKVTLKLRATDKQGAPLKISDIQRHL